MRKVCTILLALALMASIIGCADPSQPDAPLHGSTPTAPSGETPDENNTPDVVDTPEENRRIALLIRQLGNSAFVDNAAAGFIAAAEAFGFEYSVAECTDAAAFMENARALVHENYDLIVAVGWQSGDAMNSIATEFPDAAAYAIIDTVVDAENVKSINFFEQEGAYLIGVMAALVVDGESHNYGAVHVTQSAASWKWRYAYMRGVLSIDPAARFVFNYVGSFNDPALAKELALQQFELGCLFINSAAAGGDHGVFEAALEKGFFTSGQDVDLTDPNNPWIVSSQIKDTFAAVYYVVETFAAGEWDVDAVTLGVPEGGIGAVHVTHASDNPRSDRLTDEHMAILAQAVEDIKNGVIDLRTLPDEEDFDIPFIR